MQLSAPPTLRPPPRRRQPRRGFTMFELFIVVAIVGVLAGIALPNLSDLSRRARGREQVNIVGRALLEARNRARATLRCVTVSIDTSASTLALAAYASPTVAGNACSGSATAIGTYKVAKTLVAMGTPVLSGTTTTAAVAFDDNGSLVDASTGAMRTSSITLPITQVTKNNKVGTYTILPAIGAIRWTP